MTIKKAALVVESERLRSATLADLKQLQISSSRLASQAKTVTLLAASSLALIAGSALVRRRLGPVKSSQTRALIPSPIVGIGLVAGLWLASRSVFRERKNHSLESVPHVDVIDP